MSDTYTTYEAKAKLSEILRRVRAGATVHISYRGEPIAEVRPLRKASSRRSTSARIEQLVARGAVIEADDGATSRLGALGRRPGALARFLAERGE